MPPRTSTKSPASKKRAPNSARPATAAAVLTKLRALSTTKYRDGLPRFGIQGRPLGGSAPHGRARAKQCGRDRALAPHRGATGVPEARHVACMVADPALVTGKLADTWARDLNSWDICDNFAYGLMSDTRS